MSKIDKGDRVEIISLVDINQRPERSISIGEKAHVAHRSNYSGNLIIRMEKDGFLKIVPESCVKKIKKGEKEWADLWDDSNDE